MKKSKLLMTSKCEKKRAKSPLQDISLSIQQLNRLFHEIQSQTILIWNYKGLRTLPSSLIQAASHIQQIYLKHNLLNRLPDNLGCLKNLTFLYLYGNNIEELPESIGDIKTLNVLDVSNNELKYLTSAISRLTNLRSLIVSNNELSHIPAEISNLKALSLLILTGNQLKKLPESVGQLRALQGLYVDNNLIRVLPHSLINLSLLVHLSCCHNYLVNLPSKPFYNPLRPTLFFDNNPDLNFLPFSLLHDLKIGVSFDPFVIPSCGCFANDPIENGRVKISLKKFTPYHNSVLYLPTQLQSISSFNGYNSLTVPPLIELCLRFLWSKKESPHFKNILAPGILPTSLTECLDAGPVIFCEHCQASTIFMYASVIIIRVNITSQQGVAGKDIPAVLYFCSDLCAHSFSQKVSSFSDSYGTWLHQCLSAPLIVDLIS